jgi:hypothetical protein
MPLSARLALAFALSLVAAGVMQQAIMAAAREWDTAGALAFLAPIVGLITITFAVAMWRRRTAASLTWTAGAILAVMLALGLAAYAFGLAYLQPGFAGNILYKMALYLDLYVLLPAAAAVPIHWRLLRRAICQ